MQVYPWFKGQQHLQLLTINEQNILAVDSNDVDPVNLKKEDCISLYKDVFSAKGKLEGQLHQEIDKGVHPVQLPTRRVPIRAFKTRVRQAFKHWNDPEG